MSWSAAWIPISRILCRSTDALGSVELVREAATLVMLLTVGMLAGRTWQTRLGYSAIAFGVWDIFYYVFLKVIYDWPKSLFDWDILFLLPLPWWGPVLAPMSIASLMIVWGTLVSQRSSPPRASVASMWVLASVGIVLALYTFMADAIHVAHQGVDATTDGLADDVQVVGVRRGARAHGRAGRAHDTRLS